MEVVTVLVGELFVAGLDLVAEVLRILHPRLRAGGGNIGTSDVGQVFDGFALVVVVQELGGKVDDIAAFAGSEVEEEIVVDDE